MTLLMAWTDGPERWWIVSDSRLTGPHKGIAVNKITDSAAKILEIPVTLYALEGNDPLGVPIKSVTLGFAYAGSSLVALQSYVAVLPLWSRLQNAPFNVLPSMEDFARSLAYFVRAYSLEVGACQCCLFGVDPPTEILQGWEITTDGEGACKIQPIEMLDGIATYGTGASLAREKLNFLKGDIEFPAWRRAPVALLRQMLLNKEMDTVGGAVQVGMLTKKGFEVYFDVLMRPPSVGLPEFKWRGFDLQEASRVGKCIAIIRGTS